MGTLNCSVMSRRLADRAAEKRYGVEELEKCLLRNKEKGIVYHYEGQLVGDYDKCKTEEEIIEMIKTGK